MANCFRSTGIVAALLAGLWTFYAPVPSIAQDNDLIVPGKSIGVYTLGMSEKALYDQLGHLAPFWTYTWPNGTVQYNFRTPDNADLFVFVHDGKVIELTTQDAKFHTEEGVHVGSSLLEVHALMGEPICQWTPPGESEQAKQYQLSDMFYDKGQVKLEIVSGAVNYITTAKEPFECDD